MIEPPNFKQLKERLDALDFKPSGVRGQNFLIDGNMLDAIVRDAAPEPGATIIEIGPGPGLLTMRLAQVASRVVAVELDKRLVAFLRESTAGIQSIQIVQGDALGGDLHGLHPMIQKTLVDCRAPGDSVSAAMVIANLPYSIAAPLIVNLFEHAPPPRRAVVLVQKEVADRMISPPGTGEYGPLTIALAWRAKARILRIVPPQVFRPRPKVDSALIEIVATGVELDSAVATHARKLIAAVFQQRRKLAVGRLMPFFGNDAAMTSGALKRAGSSETSRAAEISPASFLALARESLKRGENE
ncbi:MAG: ribosomal RNA small subunit methyltransferase A [Planctomycetes bacterium]|nr:ribosomal RNA small subunit methyltransferase A [Planctomycetota bacterium]